MTFSFIEMAETHQTDMHLSNFGEALVIVTSAGEEIEASAIIKVTEQAENSDNGIGVVVRAELLISSTREYTDSELDIRSTWKLRFRGQTFAIEALSPPVAGFIKVNALNLSRELTQTPSLKAH